MSRAAEPISPAEVSPPAGTNPKRLCPFCGTVNERDAINCLRCGMEDSPATRQATRARIGPWHVLQSRNPAAPGMKFSTLLSLVRKGQISARSIVRGPTTQQFWMLAGNVKGISREFGLCYACGGKVETAANLCPHCQRIQEPPINPDVLLEGAASESPAAPSAVPARRPHRPYSPEPSVNVDLDPPSSPAPSGPASPLSSRGSQPNPGILTARELATAFQLEFQPQPKASPRKRFRMARAVLVLLFLGAIAAAVVGYLRPDLREQSIEWVRTTGQEIKARFEKSTSDDSSPSADPFFTGVRPADATGDSAASPPAPSSSSTAKVDPMMARPAPPDDAPKTTASPSPNPTPVVTDNATVTAGRSDDDDAEPASSATAVPPITKVPPPAPSPEISPDVESQPNVNPEAARASEPAMSEDAVRDRVRLLRRAAIDAEVDHDYAKAVNLYEQIKKLPRDTWPLDLDVRLNYARQQVQ